MADVAASSITNLATTANEPGQLRRDRFHAPALGDPIGGLEGRRTGLARATARQRPAVLIAGFAGSSRMRV
jgi:hypothetical protein